MNKMAPDRRTQRTRDACLQAFVSLLLTSEYTDITVNDVIRRANVGRSTFYDHFTGKEDLLRNCIDNPFGHLADAAVTDCDASRLLWVVGHFREQRRLVKTLVDGPTRPLLVRCLAGLIEDRIAQSWPDAPPARLPAKLAAVSVAEAQLGLILHWLSHNVTDAPPDSFADALRLASRSAMDHYRGDITPRG